MHELVLLARQSIESRYGKEYTVSKDIIENNSEEKGIFVTILKDGEIRGKSGFILSQISLYKGVIESAQNAAFDDPLHPPIDEEEFNECKIRIDIIENLKKITTKNPTLISRDINTNSQGIHIKDKFNYATSFCELDYDKNESVENVLKITCENAKLPPNTWREDENCEIYVFDDKKAIE